MVEGPAPLDPVTPAFNLSSEVKEGLKVLVVTVVGGFTMGGLSNFLVKEPGAYEVIMVEVGAPPMPLGMPGFSFSCLFK